MANAISTAFAYAVPLSAGAEEAIRLRANRRLCGVKRCYVKLNFATLLGRRCLSFGSSRSNEFLLPPAEDVAARQFILHFELHTATLLLTDTSQYGTWLSNDSTPKRSLHQATYPLVQTNDISFGHGQRYQFRIVVTDTVINPITFFDLFQRYTQSIGQKHPRLIHKLTAAFSNLDDSFISLHKVGLRKYENVNTCLRLSDGVLFAARKLFCEPVGEDDPRRAVGHRSVIQEAQILRDARHPNIVRVVDRLRTSHGPVFILEFVPTSLAAVLDGLYPKGLEAISVPALLRQCLHAVQHLHERGIRHKYLRPESILIQSVHPLRVKICNFSAADRFSHSSSLKESGVGRVALEAASRQRFFGSDIWALGVLTLTALGCSLRDLRPQGDSASEWDPWSARVELRNVRHFPCASLLAGMLHANPSLRLSAADCLQDPWLQRTTTRKRPRSNSEPDALPPAKRLTKTITRATDPSLGKAPNVAGESIESRLVGMSLFCERHRPLWSSALGWLPMSLKTYWGGGRIDELMAGRK